MPILDKFGIITQGGVELVAPTINNVVVGNTAATIGTVSFTLTNNMEEAARIHYGTTATPNSGFVDLNAGATSGTQTITGLAAGTNFTLFARAEFEGEFSENATQAFTTNTIGYQISASPTSINETTTRTTTLTVTTTNFGSGTLY